MKNAELLVRTPKPYKTESLFGYVLRLSECNGYSTPRYILLQADVSHPSLSRKLEPSKLSRIVGLPASALSHLSYSLPFSKASKGKIYQDDQVCLLGQAIGSSSRSALNLAHPRFCAQCVLEDGFLDAFWDFSYAVACPRHRCTLISHCTSCNSPLNWFRLGLVTCKCGGSLAATPASPVPDIVADLMAILQKKMYGDSILQLTNTSGFPLKELEAISLKECITIIERLTSHGNSGTIDQKGANYRIHYAAQILSNWPQNFHDYLRAKGASMKKASENTIGVRSQFSEFHGPLFRQGKYGDSVLFLLQEFIRFAISQWGKGIVNDRDLNGVQEKKRFMSLRDVSKLTNISPITLAKRIHDSAFDVKVVQIGKQKRYIIDTGTATLPNDSQKHLIKKREAAKLLALPERTLASLRESGDFSMIHHGGLRKSGYDRRDVEEFKNKLLTLAPHDAKAPNGESDISLLEILKNFKFGTSDNKADFIRKYLNGEIRALKRTGDSMQDIYFNKDEIVTFIGEKRRDGQRSEISFADAAKIIQCPEYIVPLIIAAGYLPVPPESDGFSYVSHTAVTSFANQFHSLSALARTLGSTSVRLSRLAKSAGISLTVFRHKSKGECSFIERNNVTALVELAEKCPAKKH